MAEFEALRVAIAVLGTVIATYYDLFNNRNVPNMLTYSLVGLGLLFNVLEGISSAYIILTAIVIFVLGYLLYINGQIGGADILLFAAIALLIPRQPTFFVSSSGLLEFPFIISLLITSGILFATYMLFYYSPKIVLAIKNHEVKIQNTNLILGALLTFLFIITINLLNQVVSLSPLYIGIISLIVLS
ncbi:prepilin peptidase, partial [Candidatus Micrarchaeota archaeon]|nr:prepilin peptidase [Candidatus Micrarchaeota archaeon]